MNKNLLCAVFLAGSAASAAAQPQVGNWTINDPPDATPSVYVVNDSSSVLGKFCWGGNCYWILGMDTSCVDGVKSPGMLSINDSTLPITVTCFGSYVVNGKTYYRGALSDPDTIDKEIATASRVSIVVPLQGDNFKVVRFDTLDAKRAIDTWRVRLAAPKPGLKKPTTDVTL